MNPVLVGSLGAGCIFAGGLTGLFLQHRLPSHHLSKEMQDLVKLSAGMIGTLTALVLGLLVSSAKSSFDAVATGIVQGGAKVIYLDRTLARVGPETAPVREQLKRSLAAGIVAVWPREAEPLSGLTAFERAHGMEVVQEKLGELVLPSDRQKGPYLQAQQLVSDLCQTRWLLIEESHTGLPLPLLGILIFWLFLLFISFGMFAPRNKMALVVLAVGACAVSAAIFLVLELNRPFDGLIRVSSEPMRNALMHLQDGVPPARQTP